jgi:hypothetical protein
MILLAAGFKSRPIIGMKHNTSILAAPPELEWKKSGTEWVLYHGGAWAALVLMPNTPACTALFFPAAV